MTSRKHDTPPTRRGRRLILSPSVAPGIVLMCAAVFVASARLAQAGINVWTSHGPGVAGVTALAIDHTPSSTLYAGTDGDGVFKSTDGGDTWNAANTGLPDNTFVRVLAIAPTTPPALYATTGSGVYKSTDGGNRWNTLHTYANALAIDPTTPRTLYALTGNGVDKSTDGGDTWNAANTGLPDNTILNALAIDPTTPRTLYAATEDCNQQYPICLGDGVYKSTDGGDTWKAAHTGLPNSITALAIRPGTPGTLYAGSGHCRGWYGCTGSGVYKSTDGGDTWNAANTGLSDNAYVDALAIDPNMPNTLYAAAGGVYKSTNGGDAWAAVSFPGLPVFDPNTPTTLYVGGFGVQKSTDGGDTWNAAANKGLQTGNTSVSGLAIDPNMSSTLYAAGAGVYKSMDGSNSWAAVNFPGLPVFDPTTPTTLYAAPGGAFKSTDHGDTWAAVNFPGLAVFDPNTPTTLYAVADGVHKSTDGGATWNAANTGLPDNVYPDHQVYIQQWLAIAPTRPSTLYVSFYIANAGGSRVYKSTDGGGNWNASHGGWPDNTYVNALAIAPNLPSTLYAATSPGAYKSTDGGDTWNAAHTGLPADAGVTALAIDPNISSTLYAATYYDGVFKSTDGASSWQAFNAGLRNTSVYALVIDPSTPSTLYAGTDGGGVFAITQVSPSCVGDCSGTATVAINDVITLLNIALGSAPPSACPNGGLPLGGNVNVAVIVEAVNNALTGCGVGK